MIYLRGAARCIPLSECGLARGKRFTFYDQVHTTGMDIKQQISACACLTIGKDMTFRDYAHKSLMTGTTAPIHHTPWLTAFDDSIASYVDGNKKSSSL